MRQFTLRFPRLWPVSFHLNSMNEFFPKRLCWFAAEGGPDHYEPQAEQKTQIETSELQQALETRRETPEEYSAETVRKVLERDGKNEREIMKLPGANATEGAIKMKLVEKPTTAAYIEQTDHQELRNQFLALQNATRNGVQEALKAA